MNQEDYIEVVLSKRNLVMMPVMMAIYMTKIFAKKTKRYWLCESRESIFNWFEENYVNGRLRRTLRDGTQVRLNPRHPPHAWSVHARQIEGFP